MNMRSAPVKERFVQFPNSFIEKQSPIRLGGKDGVGLCTSAGLLSLKVQRDRSINTRVIRAGSMCGPVAADFPEPEK